MRFAKIQAGFARAQRELAHYSGKPEDTEGNCLFAGETTPCTGIFGRPRVTFIPLIGGGYRKRTEVVLTITRTSRAKVPGDNTKLTRVDLNPPVDYNIVHVDTQSAVHWILTLVNIAK